MSVYRFLPLDSYSGVSPPKEQAHKGKNGNVLRVCAYEDGIVVKVNLENWTDEAKAKFEKLYCGWYDGVDCVQARAEEEKRQSGQRLAEMRALLARLTGEK